MNIRCLGCGATIQTKDPSKPGYIDKAVFEKRKNDDFYCKRCFDLKHYNKNITFDMDECNYEENLNQIKKEKGLIVYIIDLFDLDGTYINGINELFKSDNILLVINKVDLFLDSLNKNKLYKYVRTYIKERGLKVKDAFLMSSFHDEDIDLLLDKIKEIRENDSKLINKNVFFVGMTNVGKSTILNKIIKKYSGQSDLITVSNNVNTTLSNIYIPFNENCAFVDTPGLLNKESLIYYLDKESYKAITPRSYIKPKTFQLEAKQSLFIAGFLRIDFLESPDKKASFVTNFNNDLLIHRTKLENADEFYLKHLDDTLKYPNKFEREKLGDLVSSTIEFSKDKKIDIAIYGIGFISIYGNGKVNITSFKNIKWRIREALL